jgi:hypothetical protein
MNKLKNKKQLSIFLISSVLSVLLLTTFSKSLYLYNSILVFVISALVAWPIWSRLCESKLYKRRLWLDGLLTEKSKVRETLRKGTVVKIYLSILAFIFALLLLSLVSLLEDVYYFILLIDVVFIAIAQFWLTKKLAGHVKDKSVNLVSRHSIYYGNIIFLSIILATINYNTYIEFSKEEFLNIFQSISSRYSSDFVGYISASFGSIELKANHFFSDYIQEIEDSNIRFVMWLVYLIKSGAMVWLFTHFVLGSQLLIEKTILKPKHKGGIGSRFFSATMIVLAIPYFIVILAPQNQEVETILEPINQSIDICQSDNINIDINNLDNDIKERRNIAQGEIREALQKVSTEAKKELSENVDKYLDWYYSLPGEYQRLSVALLSLIDNKGRSAIDENINKIISKPLEKKYSNSINDIDNNIVKPLIKLIKTEFRNKDTNIMSCIGDNIPGLTRDQAAVAGSATSGLVAARTIAVKSSVRIANRVAATSVGKLLFKASIKRGVSTVAGAGTGALAGLVCGPAAPICSPLGAVVGGVTVWFFVDTVVIEFDELLNRDEEKQKLENTLFKAIDISIKEIERGLFLEVDQVVSKGKFSPVRNQLIVR